MALSVSQKGKGRSYSDESLDRDESSGFDSRSSTSSGSSTSSLSSSSGSESESEHGADSSEDEDEDDVSQEYLDSLLEKARASIAEKAAKNTRTQNEDASEADVIKLTDIESELECVFVASSFPACLFSSQLRGLPPLDPGALPPSYITFGESPNDAPSAIRDLDVERVMESSSLRSAPAPPVPPPELTNSGKPLTKKEKKAVMSSYN
jgi:hypothetical protein